MFIRNITDFFYQILYEPAARGNDFNFQRATRVRSEKIKKYHTNSAQVSRRLKKPFT